jgi:DNA (cytosine-5)-methyltransferase 1
MADAHDARLEGRRSGRDGAAERAARPGGVGGQGSRATHGGWADADWLGCRDDRWRPVEPGTFPLVDGIPARVGRLRGYGNAIVPQVAAQFVTALLG